MRCQDYVARLKSPCAHRSLASPRSVSVSESIELATILVTDLVGSTRLATSVGPVRADELRDEHFEVLRESIGASGGHEFKDTGDGLIRARRGRLHEGRRLGRLP